MHKRVWFTHATDIVGACAGGDGVFGAESVGYGSMRGSVWYGEISVSTVSGQTPFLEKKKKKENAIMGRGKRKENLEGNKKKENGDWKKEGKRAAK